MALFTSDKNSEKVQKTEAVLEDAAKAQEEEQAATGKVRAQSYWQVSWNIFKKNKLGMICLGIVLALVIIAILAPVLAPYGYKDQNLSIQNQNPTFAHLLGTDEYGRDILYLWLQDFSVCWYYFAGNCPVYRLCSRSCSRILRSLG